MATASTRLLKSLKIALLAFVGVYVGFVIGYIAWGFSKYASGEPAPIVLSALAPATIAAIISFVLTFYITGREVEDPPSISK